ncbi:xylulokinase [Candidatus Avoscillospira sp. LCP25S3_F1]|uniref:xylulokinase n=1 Tax=Candidatus Avoscillospira sp. LCP25S3_F1 TaxID=3438825 RepID=UPI003F923C56
MQYILAHDLGTSGDKATLFSTDGKLVASVVESYPCKYYNNNWAEQNPDDWYDAVCRATKALTAQVQPADIVGVSFSGHMMGAVFLNGRGEPLRSAIIWADQRATAEQQRLTERVGDDRFYAITGNRNNPTNSICKIMWALEHDGLAEKLHKVVNCKDFIVHRLTGSIGTDYSDASGTGAFDLNTFTWSAEILEAAGVPASVMPELHASTDLAGRVTAQAAAETGLLEGTPVYCGCGDGTAASVGTGVSAVGQGYISLGTSAWISYRDEKPLLDPQQRTFNLAGMEKGSVYPLGTMQAAGSSYSWMRDQLCGAERRNAQEQGGSIYDEINRQIAATPVGANGVLFLPYLMGERSPWWDANARGAFLGLKQETAHADLLRAVMEGVAMNLALILQVFREKHPFDTLRIIGAAAREPVWRQVLADVLNARIEQLNLLEEGCSLGAVMAAGIGAGVLPGPAAIDRFLRVEQVTEPCPDHTERYAHLLPRFADAYTRLRGFSL